MSEKPVRKAPAMTRLVVVRKEALTPHMVRVVLRGEGFTPNEWTDQYVKLVFPRPGVDYGTPFDLAQIRSTFPPDQWPRLRTYTVRWHDGARGELAVDFVLHGDRGIAGPWAAAARPGDEVLALGPGGAYRPRPDVEAHLIAGDEAALPAIGATLEALPAGAAARVIVEVADASEEQVLPSPGAVILTWLHRDAPGYDVERGLVEAVKAAPWPAGRVQVFVHGELGAMRELRRHFVDERGVPSELLSLSGYWRRGKDEDGFQAEKAEEARREREAAAAPS